MIWLWILIFALFAQAGALFLDKFLLSKNFPNPGVLTFWTAVANLFGVVFVFGDFNFSPGWRLLILALLSGVWFTVALQFFYSAMKRGEASHIAPLVGAVVPVVSFVVSYFWLGERLTVYQMIAVALLVLGAFIISFEKSFKNNGWHLGMLWGVFAGIFFALSYVFARAVYLEETFSTGFVWARVGSFLAALPLLLSPAVRKLIFNKEKKKQKQNKKGLIILAINKFLAAIYFLGLNYAISLASATLVNALAGLQYAILFILIFITTKYFPKFLKEKITRTELISQTLAILIIMAGLAFLVF